MAASQVAGDLAMPTFPAQRRRIASCVERRQLERARLSLSHSGAKRGRRLREVLDHLGQRHQRCVQAIPKLAQEPRVSAFVFQK